MNYKCNRIEKAHRLLCQLAAQTPRRAYQCMLLFFLYGNSTQQIAEALRLPAKKVAQYLLLCWISLHYQLARETPNAACAEPFFDTAEIREAFLQDRECTVTQQDVNKFLNRLRGTMEG